MRYSDFSFTSLNITESDRKFLKIVKMFMGTPQDPNKLARMIYKVSLKKHPKYELNLKYQPHNDKKIKLTKMFFKIK